MIQNILRGRMAAVAACLGLALFCSFPAALMAAEDGAIYGFSPTGAAAEKKTEESFRDLPSTDKLREYLEHLGARPHHVGSPYDKENAQWIQAQMQSWGWNSTIESFDVLFPTPKTRVLEMTAPVTFKARLQEPAFPQDATSGQTDEQLPTYNAYSIDGDVTGPLVFVNFGLPEDYDELERRGVSVKGAIVIAKYGKSWRGIKPKVAAEHGAIGCLLYSDPAVDGYNVDDTFPDGPMRNTNGVQRGSVIDFPSTAPGDPLTIGYGAVPGAKRISVKEAPGITKIPVLPISSGDAQPLLAQLTGPVAPAAWRGSLPVTYHLGAGPAVVHLKLEFNWDIKPVYDVISRLPGGAAADEWVLRGNHYDAWVNGAVDPLSGQICLLEEARALGTLARQGWQPRRTIIYCSWDGEEPGLLGSTEWVETHADELRQHAVAYVNTDDSTRGFLSMDGSPSLTRLVNDVAREISDPEAGMSVWKRGQALEISQATDAAKRAELRSAADRPLSPLGSGSDYTGFLDFLGIPSVNLAFGSESSDAGIYHSIYDDYYWYTHFGDTNFVYGKALAQTIGTTVLRLADAEVIPLEFNRVAGDVGKYTQELQELLKHKRDELEERRLERAEGIYEAIADPRHPVAPPKDEPLPPDLNFAPLLNAARALNGAAKHFQQAAVKAQPALGLAANADAVQKLNALLAQAERALTDPEGLPHRPWFKHLLFAPGIYSGYGAKTMPAVREGIELGHYAEADEAIGRVAKAIEAETSLLEEATKITSQIHA